jgi:hypothetical protein
MIESITNAFYMGLYDLKHFSKIKAFTAEFYWSKWGFVLRRV